MEIQGTGHESPFSGQRVITGGLVTVITDNGFYLTDRNGDGDDFTSDGIFIFTRSAPPMTAGDAVFVEGTVTEFLPGNVAENLTITQIISPRITVESTGNPIPQPVRIGIGGRRPPT